ncbi:MAG: hypothetical protein CV087_20215 [Candidatus Brocadia sp. WS118]|nr:MAG: hypothetical protein CV087_20215 [Candidatus Brocadia sp. WS118]
MTGLNNTSRFADIEEKKENFVTSVTVKIIQCNNSNQVIKNRKLILNSEFGKLNKIFKNLLNTNNQKVERGILKELC